MSIFSTAANPALGRVRVIRTKPGLGQAVMSWGRVVWGIEWWCGAMWRGGAQMVENRIHVACVPSAGVTPLPLASLQ